MTASRPTLDELVDGGPAVWAACEPRQLLAAFKRSGAAAGRPLLRFVQAARAWLEEPQDDVHESSRRQSWSKLVKDDFLGALHGGEIKFCLEHEADVAACAELVRHLVGTAARSSLHQALLVFEAKVRDAKPGASTSPAAREAWASHVRCVIAAREDSLRNSAVDWIARFLADIGPQGVEASMRGLGVFVDFQRCARPLALALPLVPGAVQVFTAVWTEQPSAVLAQMIQTLGREVARGIPVTDPEADAVRGTRRASETDIRRFVAGVEAGLRRTAPEESAYVRAWFDTSAEGQVGTARLFLAYLNAVPSNHEDVFELLSTWQERAGGESGVSVTTCTSMRIRTGNVDARTQLFTPVEFDSKLVLGHLGIDSAVELVGDQPLPEYAIDYLTRMLRAGHPQMGEILRRALGRSDVLDRLRGATEINAPLILDGFDDLAGDHYAATVAAELFPALLDLLPGGQIGASSIVDLARTIGRTRMYLRRVLRRIQSSRLRGLVEFAFAGSHTECEVDRFVGHITVTPLLDEITDGPGLDPWFDDMAALSGLAPALVQRMIGALPAERVFRMYDEQAGFGLLKNDVGAQMWQRLVFKTFVLEKMRELGATRAATALDFHQSRDFLLWFNSGPSYISSSPSVEVLGHMRLRWLDTIAAVNPTLAHGYLGSLLQHAPRARDGPPERACPTLEAGIEFVVTWLRARGEFDEYALHEALRERLDAAQGRGENVAALRTGIDGTLVHCGCPPLPP